MLVLFAIVVAAPGNYARMSDTTQFVHPKGLFGWIMAIGEAVVMFFYLMFFYAPYYLIVFAFAYYVGGKMNVDLYQSKSKIVVTLLIVFVAYLVISSLPNVFLYGGFGVQRSYTHIVFALLLTVVAIGGVLGVGNKTTRTGWFVVCGVTLFAIIMIVNVFNDIPTARAYGMAVDDRIEYLSSLRDKGQKETVKVSPLPIPYTEDTKHLLLQLLGKDTPMPVLYYVSDADVEPNEYEYHLKKVLKLDFDFVLANE
jgi:hypothetical protein